MFTISQSNNHMLFLGPLTCICRSAALYVNRGITFASLGRYKEALADGEACAQIRPSWAKTYECQAAAMRGLGRDEEAQASTRLAEALAILKQDPKNADSKAMVRGIREEIRILQQPPADQSGIPAAPQASPTSLASSTPYAASSAQPTPSVGPAASAAPSVGPTPAVGAADTPSVTASVPPGTPQTGTQPTPSLENAESPYRAPAPPASAEGLRALPPPGSPQDAHAAAPPSSASQHHPTLTPPASAPQHDKAAADFIIKGNMLQQSGEQ